MIILSLLFIHPKWLHVCLWPKDWLCKLHDASVRASVPLATLTHSVSHQLLHFHKLIFCFWNKAFITKLKNKSHSLFLLLVFLYFFDYFYYVYLYIIYTFVCQRHLWWRSTWSVSTVWRLLWGSETALYTNSTHSCTAKTCSTCSYMPVLTHTVSPS